MNSSEILMDSRTRGSVIHVAFIEKKIHQSYSVSSAIVQRYLSSILDAALSQNPQIQATAIDVLSFTIKQGLAHPLQVSAAIIISSVC